MEFFALVVGSVAFVWFLFTLALTFGAATYGRMPDHPLRPLGDQQWVMYPAMTLGAFAAVLALMLQNEANGGLLTAVVVTFALDILIFLVLGAIVDFIPDEKLAHFHEAIKSMRK